MTEQGTRTHHIPRTESEHSLEWLQAVGPPHEIDCYSCHLVSSVQTPINDSPLRQVQATVAQCYMMAQKFFCQHLQQRGQAAEFPANRNKFWNLRCNV